MHTLVDVLVGEVICHVYPFFWAALTVVLIGERSELTLCSCHLRFVGYVGIGRNFEISLRRRGIVNGMSTQK